MDGYYLRRATSADLTNLLRLFSNPLVYEYLWDGCQPQAESVDEWFSNTAKAPAPCGVWALESIGDDLLGVVSLKPVKAGLASAEITYALDPLVWGKGIATSMCRAVIGQAFGWEQCESILAGADFPNSRSFAVMNRLGMKFIRNVDYPAGPGKEYLLRRSDFAESLLTDAIRFQED